MTASRWFMGLDGGATKTHCVLYDMQQDKLMAACGGPINHEVLEKGMESLPGAIMGIVTPLLKQAGIGVEELDGASFGMAGVDTPMQHQIISGILEEMGFRRFVLANDACLGVKAECDGFGVSAVNGSGYSVVGISPTGEMLQIGGHNYMSGDQGGGCYLVPSTIRAAYTQLYKLGPETAITYRLFEWLGISDRAEFSEAMALRIMAGEAEAYQDISQVLYRCAAEGDLEALKILTACGEDYALSVKSVSRELKIPEPVEVVLVGSHFTKCECTHAIDTLRNSLKAAGDYNIRVISTAPVAGALFWAMEEAGCTPNENKRRELRERLRHPERSCL